MTYSNSDVRVRRPLAKPVSPVKTPAARPLGRRRPATRPTLRGAMVAAFLIFTVLSIPLRAADPSVVQSPGATQAAGSGLSPLTLVFVVLGGGVALSSLIASLRRDPFS